MIVWEKEPEARNSLPKCVVNNSQAVSLQAFAATEFTEIFSGRQPHQTWSSDVSGSKSVPIFRKCW